MNNAWIELKQRMGLPAGLPLGEGQYPMNPQHPLWGLQVLINGDAPTPLMFEKAWLATHGNQDRIVPALIREGNPLKNLYERSGWRLQNPNGIIVGQAGGRSRKASRRSKRTRKHARKSGLKSSR